AVPLGKSRRRAADVNGHVEQRAARAAHELSLRVRLLVVQAAQDAVARARMIVLNERRRQSGARKRLGVKRLHEEAAVVGEELRFDENHARKLRLGEVQAARMIPQEVRWNRRLFYP